MMTISDPSMISKWVFMILNLQNSRVFKYLFSSLYIYKNIQYSYTEIKRCPYTFEIKVSLSSVKNLARCSVIGALK